MIKIFEYIIFGIIQGLTEPIPVSSSGHVMIINSLIATGIDIELLLVITNLGSLISILYIYKNKVLSLIKDVFNYTIGNKEKYYSYKYFICLIIGTIPAGITGLIVTKIDLFIYLEKNIKFIGITLLITALFLFLIRNKNGLKNENDITYYDALVIGLYETIALVPGISRSASTIVGGLFQDLKRETAFDFSFMLYIPISIATSILGLSKVLSSNISINLLCLYFFSMIISVIVTYYACLWFKNIVKKGKLIYFVIYCFFIGITILFLL